MGCSTEQACLQKDRSVGEKEEEEEREEEGEEGESKGNVPPAAGLWENTRWEESG